MPNYRRSFIIFSSLRLIELKLFVKMKVIAAETFKNLKLKQFKKLAQTETTFNTNKQYFTLPNITEQQSGILAPKRVNQVELFKKYTYHVLPAMEQSVELDLLEKVFQKVDPLVKESLIQAYIRKHVEILAQTPDESTVKGYPTSDASNSPREKAKIFMKDFSEVRQEKIGLWIPFQYEEFKRLFPHKSPGDFLNNFLRYSRNFSLLLTDEGFKTMDFVNSARRSENFIDFLHLDPDCLKDETAFIILFNILKGDFNEALLKYRSDPIFERLFSTSVNFDSILSIIITELPLIEDFKTQEGRRSFFAELVEYLKNNVDTEQANASMPQLLFKTIKKLKVGSHTIDLLKYTKNPFPCPTALKDRFQGYQGYGSNLLFYGDHGAGKSGVLMQAIMFAHKTGCVVVQVPSGFDWTQQATKLVRHHATGLVMQPKLAVEWLQQFKKGNEELLKTLPVNLELFGKYNLSGVHDSDPDPVPNLYDERRKYHFKDYQKFLEKEEIELMIDDDQRMSVRMTVKLAKPTTVLEMVDFGIQNEFYSTNVVYEVLEQLYNQDKVRVLVVVDGFNWFYRPSCFPSFRYETDKGLRGHIPPAHLSLCRAFMHLDGHKIRNGIKLCASTIYKLHLHTFEPKHVYVPNEYGIKLNGMPLDHFKSFCEFSLQTGLWRSDIYGMNTQEQFWVETQGNFAQTIVSMREHWRDI